MTETFPAVFERFQDRVGEKEYDDYAELKRDFIRFAGKRWINSAQQERGLRIEAEKLGIPFRIRPETKRDKLERLKGQRGTPFSRIFSFTRRGKSVIVRRDKRGRFLKLGKKRN